MIATCPLVPSKSMNTALNSDVRVTKAAIGGASVTVRFAIVCPNVADWEFLFVCGSHSKLGDWMADKALEMVRDSSDKSRWTTTIQLSATECRNLLHFRYFVGYYLQSGISGKKTLVISRWESQVKPRCVLPSVEATDGICRNGHEDEFGVYGGRKKLIADGWLNSADQKVVLLRLNGGALTFYKSRYTNRDYYIKVTPFDVRHRELGSADDDCDADSQDGTAFLPLLPSFSPTDVANLSRSENCHFHEQHSCGEKFKNGEDFLIFRTSSVAIENLAFRIEFFTASKSSSSSTANNSINGTTDVSHGSQTSPTRPKAYDRFAIVYCMPASMPETFGLVMLPIISKTQQPVGQLKVEYLLISALPIPQCMERTYCRHWKPRPTLEVGHRGMGNSYTRLSMVRENTVHSLNKAAKNGADFVEFDVQLSKDKIPLIFHDFHVLVSVAKRNTNAAYLTTSEVVNDFLPGHEDSPSHHDNNRAASVASTASGGANDSPRKNSDEFHELAVKDLRLRQLRLLHLHHPTAVDKSHRDKLQVTPTDPDESPDQRPFPTLAEALIKVHPDTGFNIEIKYPMEFIDGNVECNNYFERNEYIDRILSEVLRYGKDRRILFSSFEPDICTMISLKQNKYPVLFLSVGHSKRYVAYRDERSSSGEKSVNFALCFNLLGVNFHSEDLLVDRAQVQRAHDLGLVSFVWGEDLENREIIEYFKKDAPVDGIIYDGVGEAEGRKNIFVVERESKHALLKSPSPSRTSSFDKVNTILTSQQQLFHQKKIFDDLCLVTESRLIGI